MRFKIVWCKKDSGEDVELTIEAPNAQWAERMAQQRGILTSSVEAVAAAPVAPPPVPPRGPGAPVQRAPGSASARAPGRAPAAPGGAPSRPAPPPPPQEEVVDDLVPLEEIPEEQLQGAPVKKFVPPTGPVIVEREEDEIKARSSRGAGFSLGLPVGATGPFLAMVGVLCLAGFLWVVNKSVIGDPPTVDFQYAMAYAPADAQALMFVDVARLRTSPMVQDMQEQMASIAAGWNTALPINFDQVEQLFVAMTDDGFAMMVRTRMDYPLGKVTGPQKGKAKTVEGVRYVEYRTLEGTEFGARVDRNVYLFAANDGAIRKAIEAGKSGGRGSPDVERQSAMVGGQDHVLIMTAAALKHLDDQAGAFPASGGAGAKEANPFKSVGVGVSVADNVTVNGAFICETREAAEEIANGIELIKSGAVAPTPANANANANENANANAPITSGANTNENAIAGTAATPNAPGPVGADAAKPNALAIAMFSAMIPPDAKRAISAVRVTKDGATIKLSGAWPYQDVKKLLDTPVVKSFLDELGASGGDGGLDEDDEE